MALHACTGLSMHLMALLGVSFRLISGLNALAKCLHIARTARRTQAMSYVLGPMHPIVALVNIMPLIEMVSSWPFGEDHCMNGGG